MLQPTLPQPILVISRSEQVARQTVDVLRWAKHQVSAVRTRQEAQAWLQRNRAHLVVVELDLRDMASGGEPVALLTELQAASRRRTPLLALIRRHQDAPVQVLFERARLTNFIAVDGELDPAALVITVSKILGQDIFGVEPYLGPGTTHREYMVDDSAQKEQLVQTAEKFALDAGCHQRVARQVGQVADELLTNAIYDAPVDAYGNPRFSGLPRTVPVMLDEGEEVFFRLATDGKRIALSATDPFGALAPDTVLDCLTRCFARGDDQIDDKPGGAGLGLYSLFNLVNHLVINIHPGRQTEAIGIVEVTRSYREFAAANSRSLNIFVAESA